MKITIFKKIISLTFLIIFLFIFFIPFNQSLAQTPSLKIERQGTNTITRDSNNNYTIDIRATAYDMHKPNVYFKSSSSGSFTPQPCKDTSPSNSFNSFCSVVYSSSAAGSFTISAETTASDGKKYTSNDLTLTVYEATCGTNQRLENGNCINTLTTDTTYKLLAPLPGLGDDGTAFNTKGECALAKYLNILIKLIMGIAAVLAMIMITVGGIEYMTTELISSKEAGREAITNAIFGLLIALGSYVLLNTINPTLLNLCPKLEEATITIGEEDVPQTPDQNGKYPNGDIKGSAWDDKIGKIKTQCTTENQTDCLPRLVSVYNSECTVIGQPGCTSTRRLNTINLRKIQYGCLCNLVITGGTESWLHGGRTGKTSHQKDSSTIDLRFDPLLDAYIKSGTRTETEAGTRYSKDGISYLLEKTNTHWHVGP